MSKPRHRLTQFHRPMMLKLERWHFRSDFLRLCIFIRVNLLSLFKLWQGFFILRKLEVEKNGWR